MRSLKNIFWLGIKELRSLTSDTVMLARGGHVTPLAAQVPAGRRGWPLVRAEQ